MTAFQLRLRSRLARRLLPPALRAWWRRGEGVNMGDLGSLEPPSRLMGLDRGTPVDRWYIERFLAANAARIRGRVLEVADDRYTRQFGGDRVTARAVLHAVPGNAAATLVGNLETGEGIPDAQFDCAIVTQVLECVFEVGDAVRHIHRMLAPGGTALVTVPAIAPVSRYDADRWGEYWHFSEQSAARLFGPVFGTANVRVESHGNHAAAHACVAGMAAAELSDEQRTAYDADYPVVVTVVATREPAGHAAGYAPAPPSGTENT
jgi:SAM-dependent methyltransferase